MLLPVLSIPNRIILFLKSVLLLPPLKLLVFQVTIEPVTKPEPKTVIGLMSCFWPAVAPLGLIDVMDEVTVGEAPRLGL